MSIQEHHVKSNVPSHRTYASLPTTLIVTSEVTRALRRNTNIKKHNAKKGRISLQMYQQYQGT